MSNVTEFPKQADAIAAMFGPETPGNSLVIDGRLIPGIRVHDRGPQVEFILDGRFSFSFPRDQALQAASFAAAALAIGSGYSHIGATNKDRPFAPELIGLSSIPA